jgi:chromosome segregation ATPase
MSVDARLQALEEKTSKQSQELEIVQKDLKTSEARIGAIEEELSQIEKDIRTIKLQIPHISSRLGNVEIQLDARLRELTEKLKQLQNKFETSREKNTEEFTTIRENLDELFTNGSKPDKRTLDTIEIFRTEVNELRRCVMKNVTNQTSAGTNQTGAGAGANQTSNSARLNHAINQVRVACTNITVGLVKFGSWEHFDQIRDVVHAYDDAIKSGCDQDDLCFVKKYF